MFTPFMLAISSSTVTTIVILVVMVAAFYFLLIRPQKKQEKAANDMRNNMKVGDEVTSIGGIVGKIVSLKDETVVLETTKDKTHIRLLRAAIRSVDVRAEDSVAPAKISDAVPATGKKKGDVKKPVKAIAPEVVKETEVLETPVSETVADAPADVAVATEIATTEAIADSSDEKKD